MPRYIDADNAISVFEILADKCADDKAFEQAISVLKDVPTADVVEKEKYISLLNYSLKIAQAMCECLTSDFVKVVRCKDCLLHGVCRFELGLGAEGFCSQCERREDDAEIH